MLLKKALLISYHFPPSSASGSFRLLGFARHLPNAGWQPLVVAPPTMPWEPSDADLVGEVPAEAVVRAVAYPSAAPKLLRYLAPYAVWLPHAWSACKQMIREHRPDVVLTSGPPHCVHLLGHYLKAKTGLPWIADFRDPWISDGKSKRLSLMRRWALRRERTVFRNADLVLANAPNACRLYRETYPDQSEKIVTLTNGFDPRPGERPGRAATQDSCLQLLHAGELYFGRDPLPLFEALASANSATTNRSHELHILGRNDPAGVDFPRVVQERGWSDFVCLHGQQAYQDTLDAMERADILVLFDTPGRTIGVPAKLYEYLGAGRPILALAESDGDVAAILRQSGVSHRIASPKNAGAIRQAIEELRQEMRVRPAVSDPSLLEQFTRAHLTHALAEMLDALIGERSSTALRRDPAQAIHESGRAPHVHARKNDSPIVRESQS